MASKNINWKKLSYFVFFTIFLLFLFFLGSKYQNEKDIKKYTNLNNGLVHGKCPYWGEYYSWEYEIPKKYTENAKGNVSVFNGQVTKIGNNAWEVRTPITRSGFNINSQTEFPEGKNFKVGDCIRFISDMDTALVVLHQ